MGTKLNDILKKHLKAPAPDVRHLIPECPATLAHLIKRSMEKDPTMRPSAADFAAALRAETITWQGDVSGSMSGSIDIAPLADSSAGRSASTDKSSDLQGAGGKKNIIKSWPFWISSGALLVTVMGLFVFVILPWLQKPKPRKSIELTELSRKFESAPETYGLLPPNTMPKPEDPAALGIPSFSWVGKVNIENIRFVASRNGKYFYPFDSPQAALIRLDNFVGYKTASQAVRDGKRPAR
ncbi:MAG: hypothetical protein E4H40_01235 [Candidatus Brocadiia bacterium]|nr:MAG: hypothetical protein E4H40_01235 [Candidatus Brocadiia bacterium]